MERDYILAWLNYRLTIGGGHMSFNNFDVDFLVTYIDHYKKVKIHPQKVINTLNKYLNDGNRLMYHIDFVINKVVKDFNIKTDTAYVNDVFSNMMNPNSDQKIIRYH